MFSISCKRASELVHKRLNEGLTTTERWRLKVHTSMCSACKVFEKQTEQIEEAIKAKLKQNHPTVLDDFKTDTLSKLKK